MRAWVLVACVISAPFSLGAQTAPAATAPEAAASAATPAEPVMAFTVEVLAPKPVQAYLLRHLDLMRYRSLSDLDDTELDRLQLSADQNVRDLLGTLGYFSPQVDISRATSDSNKGPSRVVRIAVQTGPSTTVTDVRVGFSLSLIHISEPTRPY